MEETTILIHDFLKGVKPKDQDKVRKDLYPYFNPEQKKYVRKYDNFVPLSGMYCLQYLTILIIFNKICFVLVYINAETVLAVCILNRKKHWARILSVKYKHSLSVHRKCPSPYAVSYKAGREPMPYW
jgi:hypothetical protein